MIGEAFLAAFGLLAAGDAETWGIIGLSLGVSLSAAALGFLLGVPVAATLAMRRFRGRQAVLVVVNAGLGLPPVLVGLLCYLMLSRSGPLGFLGWLFTPQAMIAAQTLLAWPVAIALAHRVLAPIWADHGDALRVDGAGPAQAVKHLLLMARAGLVTVFLACFGRCIAEVGAILLVGGNIRGQTRTMTTAIALETSKGDLPLALGLGAVLVAMVVLVSAVGFWIERRTR